MPIGDSNNGAINTPNEPIVPETDTPVIDTPVDEGNSNDGTTTSLDKNEGKSNKYDHPSKIHVTITDDKVPIVVLFGPPSCGKTMTLVRLARYLKNLKDNHYTIEADRQFRSDDDSEYKDKCANFDRLIDNENAAGGTKYTDFMLLKVMNERGKVICQILEAPGELYFDGDPNKQYPPYVRTIINSMCRKVWAIIVEPEWKNQKERSKYVERITKLKRICSVRDKFLFILNKVDTRANLLVPGGVNTQEAIHYIQNLYPDIFHPFENKNPITRFLNPYNCKFVPFSTGTFDKIDDKDTSYTQSSDEYPRELWKAILKYIRG